MKKTLATLLGFGLLAALPAHAKSGLTLTCITRDLVPGTHVWIEVEPQYQQMAAKAGGAFKDSAPRLSAKDKHVWQFEVPARGEVAPVSYEFTFPDDVSRAQSDHFGSIYLKTRFKIDNPQGSPRAGYGEVNEMTFGMPVPAGATQLSRCLRLRDEGNRLTVETAADCRDSTFDQARLGGHRVHMKPTP